MPLCESNRRVMLCFDLLKIGVVLFLAPIACLAQNTVTQRLEADIVPLGALFTQSTPVILTKSNTNFNRFVGTMTLSYRARTSQWSGRGAITLKATTDFTPAGGPSISRPPSAGDLFTYTCGGATLGASCGGTQTVSTTAATNVVTLGDSACTGGGAPCSSANPNTANITFTLTDDPTYKTGSYSVTLTWTISAS
jgi:hypothetical protein